MLGLVAEAAVTLWNTCLVLLPCCLLLLSGRALSQTDSLQRTGASPVLRPILRLDSIALSSATNITTTSQSRKSPWLAVGLSAIAPGAGQFYNTNYWKVPVILGLGGYWIYEWTKLNNKYRDFRDQYNQSLITTPPDGNARLLSNRDFYRDERDKFAWYLGALYFLNVVDAYVGAHLYDFDVSPDLGLDGRVEPRLTATLRWTF